MNKLRSLICCVLLYFWVVYSFANEAPIKANVTVVATPSVLQPNELVTISGISPLDANGAVKVRITPSGGKPPIDLIATPSKSGDYSVNFRGTLWSGEYKVGVTSPGGRITGQGAFTVAVMEPLNEIDEAVQEARLIEAEIKKVAADLDTQIALLPANPEREQLKAKWANLKPLLLQASRDFGDIDSLLAPLPAAARQDPSLRPALMPFARKLADWRSKARPERERINRELISSRRNNVKCENLERIKEGFNFASALFNLGGGIKNALKSVVIDYLASKVNDKVKKASESLGFTAAEYTKISVAVAEATKKGWSGQKALGRFVAKEAAQGTVIGLLSDAAAFAADQVFNAYCERMGGPFQGFMRAEFFAQSTGQMWWNYDIYYSGKLELRYAKGATSGTASAVSGEFIGQATKFTLWENSMRIGFPDLTRSAIMFRRALLPRPQLFMTGSSTEGTTAGSEEKAIDVEGKAAATFLKPYSFFVPVEGEIVNNVLTLRIKPATSDYTAVARVVYVFISPLTFVPVPTAFELPYKEADFFFKRVSKGAELRFPVVKQGRTLRVDGSAKNNQGNKIAKGTYTLNVKLCNPMPDSGGPC
jgi:hypothetical protein